MNRKNFIIASTVFIFIFLSVGAYFFFQKSTTSTPSGDLFPGSSNPVIIPVSEGEGEVNIHFTPGSGQALPRLYRLHNTPVSGIASFETGKGSDHTISARYIERGLGHIYETALSTYTETRIVNETRSKIIEALWGKGGQSVVVRSLNEESRDTIKTRIINLGTPTNSFNTATDTPTQSGLIQTEEILLPDYIPFMAVAGDESDKLFYLENSAVSAMGTTATFKNTSPSNIFKSSFTEWIPQFPNQKLVTLTTKPSNAVPGHFFFLDPKTKSVIKILSGINGLTTLTNRSGKLVIYSESKDQGLILSVYDTVKKEIRNIALQTLPEKCVWSTKSPEIAYCAVPKTLSNSLYPDRWYQGIVSFSDDLWVVDTQTTVTKKLLNPETLGGQNLDMTNLVVSSGDEYLLFMDKNSGKPWVYRLLEEAPLATVPQSQATSSTSVTIPTFSESEPSLTEGMTKIR